MPFVTPSSGEDKSSLGLDPVSGIRQCGIGWRFTIKVVECKFSLSNLPNNTIILEIAEVLSVLVIYRLAELDEVTNPMKCLLYIYNGGLVT